MSSELQQLSWFWEHSSYVAAFCSGKNKQLGEQNE
jgi:hypothetical protein